FGQNDLLVEHELECVYAHRPIDAGIPKPYPHSVCGDKSRALRKAKPSRSFGGKLQGNVRRIEANYRGVARARDEETRSTLTAADVSATKPRRDYERAARLSFLRDVQAK